MGLVEYLKDGSSISWFDRKPDLDYPIYGHVLVAGVGWSVNLLFWIVALQYITTVKASIIANLHPLLLVIYMRLTGHEVSVLDWTGVIVTIAGIFVIGSEELLFQEKSTSNVSPVYELLGYVLCFFAACGELVVILNRKRIKKYVPLMQVKFIISSAYNEQFDLPYIYYTLLIYSCMY
jgi:drug/metabolite transporter (DMT)-like permease